MSQKRKPARFSHNEYLQYVHDVRESAGEQWSPEELAEWESLPQDNTEAAIEARIRFFQRRNQPRLSDAELEAFDVDSAFANAGIVIDRRE